MPVAPKLPNGTRVRNKDGRSGQTTAYLPNKGAVGGYTVKWDDDASQTDCFIHQLDSDGGTISASDYENALTKVTKRLGGYTAKAEGKWIHEGKSVESVLIVSKPSHLKAGEEMHAHASVGGGLHKVHVKAGNSRVRDVFKNGRETAEATKEDKAWIADIKLRNMLINSKAAYLQGTLKLPA